MALFKFVLRAVFTTLLLSLPCESGLLTKALNKVVNVVQDAANVVMKCPAPKRGCPNSNIAYFLYTRETQQSPYQIDPANPETFTSANFVEGAPLKVIFHGYSGWKDYSPNIQLRPAFFEHGEYNIISVDWSLLGPEPCYLQAVDNVEVIVECTAQFLDTLLETRSDLFDLQNTHVMGYSLGAHIAGLMAASLKTGKVHRVTGFDPAAPLFGNLVRPRENMLNPDVADFVDVYHSNTAYKGKKEALGHIDIYLNNGASQPGCNCNSSCDHVRSVDLFAEAINSPEGLWSYRCNSWSDYKKGSCEVGSTDELVNLAGDSIVTKDHGVYWTFTFDQSPYLVPASEYVENSSYGTSVDVSCTYIDYLF